MSKLRVFVSSVQKELENERLAVLSLISTDAFLQVHCEPVLYEFEPASPEKAAQECLDLLGGCEMCLAIIWKDYGHAVDGISITRREYRLARSKGFVERNTRHPMRIVGLNRVRLDEYPSEALREA